MASPNNDNNNNKKRHESFTIFCYLMATATLDSTARILSMYSNKKSTLSVYVYVQL